MENQNPRRIGWLFLFFFLSFFFFFLLVRELGKEQRMTEKITAVFDGDAFDGKWTRIRSLRLVGSLLHMR